MTWGDVGNWLKTNTAPILGLVGSVATGNIPGGIAAAASLISNATGKDVPDQALKVLQTDPASILKLKELAQQNEEQLRQHQENIFKAQLEDQQKEHDTTQQTIRTGDTAEDEYVRHTRPMMARQSWYAGSIYVIVAEVLKWVGIIMSSQAVVDGGKHVASFTFGGASPEIAACLFSPALTYMGMRTWDKWKGNAKKVV